MSDTTRLDPTEAFAQLALIRHGEMDLSAVLQRICDIAVRTIPGAHEVSVSLIRDSKPATAAYTGDISLACDESQYETGYGPCLDAAQGGEVQLVEDMRTEQRWPDYTPKAVAAGVRSSMSIGLPVQQAVTGALNVYAIDAGALSSESIELGQAIAGYAAVALANAHLYASTAALAAQMQEAMESRAVIEQAKGILVAQQGCTPTQAFDLLAAASQTSNRKLRDIAAAIVEGAQRGQKS